MAQVLDSILLEYTQDKVIVIDENGVLQYANAATERILGYDQASLEGVNAFDLIHEADVQGARACFESVVQADEPTTRTYRYRVDAADGDLVWMESRFSNVTDDAIGGYVVSSRDVTEQVEAERERAEAQQRLTTIAGTVGDVLWMFTADWTELCFVNPAYEDVFGVPIAELEADPTTFVDAIHPEDREHVREAMARATAGESIELEYRVNPEQDYERWVWVQGEPIEEDGEVVRIVGFARDVTDRQRRERQLVVMDNLLRHNIRNDMSVVLGNAEMIAAEGHEPAAGRAEIIRSKGQQLVRSADKQREIIDLLTHHDSPARLDVVEVVREAAAVVRRRHPAAELTLQLPEEAHALAMYELQQAVEELIENAIEHDPSDAPAVTITVENLGDVVDVLVADRAPLIPEVEYRVLTGEWVQDDVYHSSGLGLWLVHWVADLSNASVSFDRREGGGNEIRLRLQAPEA